MKSTILIVGAGNIGSRHLQGLSQIEQPLDIYLYDLSQNALRVAMERFNEVKAHSNIKITILDNIANSPEEIDLAIIATTSNIRLQVMRKILGVLNVKNIILEKVMFQDLREYGEAAILLGEKACTTWVNCNLRQWPLFVDLKERYTNDPNLTVICSGSNWGLGCNSVHNTDLAAFLWDGIAKHDALLDVTVTDSKRKNFKEFTGELITRISTGGQVHQISYARGNRPYTITVNHPLESLTWDIINSRLYTSNDLNGWIPKMSHLAAPLQSQLTSVVVARILEGRDCGLPGFHVAARVHLETLEALLTGMRRNGVDFGAIFPIT
jgi:hypothetical protein